MSIPNVMRKAWGNTVDGRPVDEFVLRNSGGSELHVMTYGATITRLIVPDKTGGLGDVVTGFDDVLGFETKSPYFGATIGRYGNRIGGSAFTLDGKRYSLVANEGKNQLHGGPNGYGKRIWHGEAAPTGEGPAVRFTLVDPDGSEGYPGTVKVSVVYTLTNANVLRIAYEAVTDKATPINLTNHAYFNLKDGGKSDVLGHVLQIEAEGYTPVDRELIPTGEIAPVEGTGLDFRVGKEIGRDIGKVAGGYDHNFVLRSQGGEMARAGEVWEKESGRVMEVWTTEPGMQFYSSNFLDGSFRGKGGVAYGKHAALCLETQHYPDSPNREGWPSTIVRPGETYRTVTEYRFGVR